jgi:uncharacterized protein YrrD
MSKVKEEGMMLQPPTVLPVDNLTGNAVVNVEGERLGTIATYGIDLERGRVAYAVLSVGGFRDFVTNGLRFPGTPCSSLLTIRSSFSM